MVAAEADPTDDPASPESQPPTAQHRRKYKLTTNAASNIAREQPIMAICTRAR